jgi:hypothetical protein
MTQCIPENKFWNKQRFGPHKIEGLILNDHVDGLGAIRYAMRPISLRTEGIFLGNLSCVSFCVTKFVNIGLE